MTASAWLTAGSVFILILIITLGIGWYIRNKSTPTPPPPNRYNSPQVWSPATASDNPDKNTCLTYQFPTALVNINGVPTAVPGNPTFNSGVLDSLKGVSGFFTGCLDADQIIAQQLTHTCIAPEGVVDGAITRCFLLQGGTTGLSGSENFYSDTFCPNIGACLGELALVSINFQAPSKPPFCIQDTGQGNNALMLPCNPSVNEQLFRVTRVDPGQDPNSLQPGQGQNGLLAQILNRDTQFCLQVSTQTAATLFDPKYLPDTACATVSPQFYNGPAVTFTTCTGGDSPGYVWMLLPSLPYCTNASGCSGSCPHTCTPCTRANFGNTCGGCSTCTGSAVMVTPPQIVYTGNLDMDNIPLGTGYAGLTGDSAVAQWLVDNHAQSLYFGGTGDGLILRDFGTDYQVCNQRAFLAQYMNLTSYNIISQEAVCLADGTSGTTKCTDL